MCLFGNGNGNGNNSELFWIVVIGLLIFCCSDGNIFGCGNGGNSNNGNIDCCC